MNYSSELIFVSSINEILKSGKFEEKRNKLKFNNRIRMVDINEIIIEHTTGVLYCYENTTSNLNLWIELHFNKLL